MNKRTILLVHAVLACLAFGFIFPLGGIMIRVLSFPGLLWVHGVLQIVGYITFIVAAGLGIWMATNPNSVSLDPCEFPGALVYRDESVREREKESTRR